MQFAQEHINLVNSGGPIDRRIISTAFIKYINDFIRNTNTIGERYKDFDVLCWYLKLDYPNSDSDSEYDIFPSVYYHSNNKLPFATLCALSHVYAGWCVVSMDFSSQGETLLRKKCKSIQEVKYTGGIIRTSPHSLYGSMKFKRKFKECVIEMSFPTRMLSSFCELGIV